MFWCYVDCLIDVMVKIMSSKVGFTGSLSIGNPGNCTILQLADTVLKLSGSNSKIIPQPLSLDGPKQCQSNIDLARAKLDGLSRVNSEDGVIEIVAYFKKALSEGDT